MINASNNLLITKTELQSLINYLMGEKCSLYWRNNSKDEKEFYMIIDTNDTIDEVKLIKNGGGILVDIDSVNSISHEKIKDKICNKLKIQKYKIEQSQTEDAILKSKKHLQLEIDYHLLELHEYIQQENNEMIDVVKDVLLSLTNQLKYHSER